jgi:hypothetical protein
MQYGREALDTKHGCMKLKQNAKDMTSREILDPEVALRLDGVCKLQQGDPEKARLAFHLGSRSLTCMFSQTIF